jgi:hypothetical protein
VASVENLKEEWCPYKSKLYAWKEQYGACNEIVLLPFDPAGGGCRIGAAFSSFQHYHRSTKCAIGQSLVDYYPELVYVTPNRSEIDKSNSYT